VIAYEEVRLTQLRKADIVRLLRLLDAELAKDGVLGER
jgi:hypothetical protein